MPDNKKDSKNRITKGMMIVGTAITGFFALVGKKLYSIVKFDKVNGKDDPFATVKRTNNMKRIAVMIGLLILMLISIILMLRGYKGGAPQHGSVDIPGNVIDLESSDPSKPPETATSVELTTKDGYDNIPFEVKDMLPGDSIAQYYCVSVTHDTVKNIRFCVNMDTEQKLSNVLRVKVEELIPNTTDVVLYDGLMKDCTAATTSVTADSETITPIYYRITVYTLGAEVGNEYVGESLNADFAWQLQ